MILQLNPALPFDHIEKGEFLAHFLHDNGIESDLYFTGILKDSGEIWTYSNRELRGQKNITIGRILKNKSEVKWIIKE